MPFSYARKTIPDGIAGTLATVEYIAKIMREWTNSPLVREVAIEATRGLPWKNKRAEASGIFNWLRRNIRFTYDPEGAELLQTPEVILNHRAADCDDFVILGGAMLRSIGIPVRIVIIGAEPRAPEAFSHIYLQAFTGDAWVGFDPSVTDSRFGWEPPRFSVKKIIPVED